MERRKKSQGFPGAAVIGLAVAAMSSAVVAADGEAIYYTDSQPACMVCHDGGTAGAPRVGHPEDWTDRLDERGMDEMVQHVIGGMTAMPPYRGRLSEEEARAAIEYMLNTLE